MKKKNVPHIIAATAIVVFITLGLASASTPPDVSKALTPTDLSIDPDNCAYLIGPILAIDNHNVTEGSFLALALIEKTVRVPAGKQLNVGISAGISHNYRKGDGSWGKNLYDAKQEVAIPPLDNGRIYKLSTGNFDINESQRLLMSFDIFFSVSNTETNRYEHISTQKVILNPPVRAK